MKCKKTLWCLLPLLLTACGGGQSSSSYSQPEGLYSKLSKAIEEMASSFKADGTFNYLFYDGSSTTETNYTVDIEVSADAYYYEEQDLRYDNPTVVENYYKTADGKLGRRNLDYTSNQIVESYYETSYDVAMKNDFSSLEVKQLKAIREQPNWYNVQDYNISRSFVTFLTGYSVMEDDGLSLSQLAVHFDGDSFDQFYILMEYEEEYDESSSSIEQYLFQLDITGHGTTTPKKLEAFEEKADHEALREAFFKFSSVKNYTMHFDVDYEDTSIEDTNYDFILDFKNNALFSTEQRTGVKIVEVKDEETGEIENDYVEFPYNIGFKNGANGKPYSYYFDPTSHELLRSYDLNEYWGYTGTQQLTVQNLFAWIGLVDAACYKSLGNNTFTTYELQDVSTVSLRALLPFAEWRTCDLTLKVDADYNLTIILSETVSVSVSEMNYVRTQCTTTITFKDVNTSEIPAYLLEA